MHSTNSHTYPPLSSYSASQFSSRSRYRVRRCSHCPVPPAGHKTRQSARPPRGLLPPESTQPHELAGYCTRICYRHILPGKNILQTLELFRKKHVCFIALKVHDFMKKSRNHDFINAGNGHLQRPRRANAYVVVNRRNLAENI